MNLKKTISLLLMLILLCSSICTGCCTVDILDQTDTNEGKTSGVDTLDTIQSDTQYPEPEPFVPVTPIDIDTIGGVVIVGNINCDDQGWYIQPIQPLNINFEYFLDNPSVFPEQTRIAMFDPKLDGIEKALYIGQTITAAGTFAFYRDDFETLYFTPYTITIGKNAENSYSAPDLRPQDTPENLYDPSTPLPKYMDTMIVDGKYYYNAFMLSMEAIEFMGNDFAVFYVGFVDAFLNYQTEFPCPDEQYAEMLSTIIYYELPLYNAVAEPFEYFRHYDHEKGTVSIQYKYDKETFEKIKGQFFEAANEMLTAAKPGQTDAEMAKNIYHALSSRMTYDYSALTEFERKENYYAYLNNSGVCITFANVYNQLLTQVGIETTLAHCDSTDTIGHSWSIVTLDGQQYFCDPTYELSYDGGNGYRFFGMNYADRTADGLGSMGIRIGRYYTLLLDESNIAPESLEQ
ncbi:MAG: transglutaminase domain-containing protein [Ruminococcaceae bacterium]|nr:transglutaminase domain-containing protein [Oscillospiraceae bacterium]